MTDAVTIDHVRKRYPASGGEAPKEALKDICLRIPKGSFFGLLGPNGAGKSTLINILAGLVIKSSGSVAINGHDIDEDMRGARISLGVVPQELVLDTFFTVRQALDIYAGYYGVPKAQRRTDEIIHALGLSDKANINARRLSGGMRRRLLVGKALVHNPPVLILDEPTAGVDVELREQLWEYVKLLNQQGTTVLLTTHYLEEAEELCDTIAIINHGELIACEPKRDIMRRVDSKQVIFTMETPLREVPEALRSEHVSINAEGELVVCYQPSHAALHQWIEKIQEAAFIIKDLRSHEADLEDVFRQLTKAA